MKIERFTEVEAKLMNLVTGFMQDNCLAMESLEKVYGEIKDLYHKSAVLKK